MVTKRFWHNLRGNKSSMRPVRHLFVDVESRLIDAGEGKVGHVLWFGYCAYWRRRPDHDSDTLRYLRFDTVSEFWSIVFDLAKDKTALYLVSHNTAYDFGVLHIFPNLEADGFKLTSIYLGGLSVIMRFKEGKRKIVLLDNANFFQGKLATLGAAIGFPKHDVDPLTAPLELVDPYCKRDVEILVKLWQAYYTFIDEHDLGNWGATLPSQAFKAFRHRFMKHKITIHADEPALEMEREAYHGGRTSAFWTGAANGQQFYKVDVNSMYPYVMAKETYPRQFYGLRGGTDVAGLEKKLKQWLVIARVTIETDEPVYPIMVKGHLVHPVGRFDTVLSTPELRYAIDHGHLERVHEMALYFPAPIFSEYVKFFYGLKDRYRQEGNGTSYLMVKLYLNSLYGKFGQKSELWEKFDGAPPGLDNLTRWYDAKEDVTWRVYHFGGQVWRSKENGEARDSFPAIAAHVTAYARLYLWKLIKTAGRGHSFYTDTDSIIVDQTGYDNLAEYMDESRLGALKIEAQDDNMRIVCPKHYRMGDEWKRKGVPSKAEPLGGDVFKCTQFPSFKTQRAPGEKDAYQTKTVIKHLTGRIYDGVKSADGWIEPLDASDLELNRVLSDEHRARLDEIEAQCDALQETLPIDGRTVFKLWDYRKGAWKQARNKQGHLVALEYSNMDAEATELGFSNLAELQAGVQEFLQIRGKMQELHAEASLIKYPEPSMDTQGPLVF